MRRPSVFLCNLLRNQPAFEFQFEPDKQQRQTLNFGRQFLPQQMLTRVPISPRMWPLPWRCSKKCASSLPHLGWSSPPPEVQSMGCLLYTSDAADDLLCVDLGGRRIIKKSCGLTSKRRGHTAPDVQPRSFSHGCARFTPDTSPPIALIIGGRIVAPRELAPEPAQLFRQCTTSKTRRGRRRGPSSPRGCIPVKAYAPTCDASSNLGERPLVGENPMTAFD